MVTLDDATNAVYSGFLVEEEDPAPSFRALAEERRVGNDNTVKWRGMTLQIPPEPAQRAFRARHAARSRVPDGRLAILHGPHRLADYDPQDNLCDEIKLAEGASPVSPRICG